MTMFKAIDEIGCPTLWSTLAAAQRVAGPSGQAFAVGITALPTSAVVVGDLVPMSGTERGYADVIAVDGTTLTLREFADNGDVFEYPLQWGPSASVNVYRAIDAPTLFVIDAQCSCSVCAPHNATTNATAAPMFGPPRPVPYVHDYAHTEELVWMIDAGFPADVTAAFLAILTSDNADSRLRAAYDAWCTATDYGHESPAGVEVEFEEAIEHVVGDECFYCGCGRVVWRDETTYIDSEDLIVCDARCLNNYSMCDGCSQWVASATRINYASYCDSCASEFAWCEECEVYYDRDYSDHDHHETDCDCCAPFPRFAFPANGHGTIRENERLTVELPAGVIDERGMTRIASLVRDAIGYDHNAWYQVTELVDNVGPQWQTKRGNFTRRLSSALHKIGVHLPAGTLSEVGNLATQYSSREATWHLEVTRDLNLPADAFAHEDSCWWDTYNGNRPERALTSRCALKSFGGLALRTYASADDYRCSSDDPSGRAWILPMDANMRPTHDATSAHAFVIFNAYGDDLSGYVAARLVAHLADCTYRKVSFDSSVMYINGDTGYLVADQATCDAYDSVNTYLSHHDSADARDYARKLAALAAAPINTGLFADSAVSS